MTVLNLTLARIEMGERRRRSRADLASIGHEVSNFARNHPWWLAGIAVLACAIDVVVAFGFHF